MINVAKQISDMILTYYGATTAHVSMGLWPLPYIYIY